MRAKLFFNKLHKNTLFNVYGITKLDKSGEQRTLSPAIFWP